MRLKIRSHGFSLTEALVQRVQKRFQFAMRHGSRALALVTVRLRDINGPRKGGVDKRCGVELCFAHGGTVMLEETDDSLYAAIDRAAGRSKHTILKRLDRLRSRGRNGRTRV